MKESVKYKIVETECFPCRWKCQIQPPYKDDNATRFYHKTKKKAKEYIDKIGGILIE